MDGHTKFAGTLAWSSSMIYLGSRDTSILQRDPRAHESFLAIVKGHIDRVLHLLISPDGQTIMTGAGNGILRFRNVFPLCRSQVNNRAMSIDVLRTKRTCVNQLGSSRIKFTHELKPLRIFSFDGDWNLCPLAARGNLGDCKGCKQAAEGDSEYLLEDKLQEICEKLYNQILPIMTEKVHREKLQGVQTRLTYGESSHQNSRTREETQFSESEPCDRRRRPKKRKPSPATTPRDLRPSQNMSVFSGIRREGDKPTRRRSLVSTTMFTRLGHRDGNVFTHLGEGKRNVHSQLGPKVAPWHRHASERRSACSNKSEDLNRRKEDARSLIRSYITCSSERRREIEEEWYAADRVNRRQLARTKEAYLSEDENDQGGHFKSRPKKRRSNGEDNLSQPWLCEETNLFTARIR
nr:protein fizzy-related 2 [Tanacetum cinerariifolium]